MVHEKISTRNKSKPRGRPFAPGNKSGKPRNDLLDASGRKTGIEGGVITLSPCFKADEGVKPDTRNVIDLPTLIVEGIEKVLKNSNIQQESISQDKDQKSLELIESIEFKNGENTLTIRFSKKHNRMFRIQVFMNESIEVRPVTYTGSSNGYGFWNLLKGALKK